MEFGTIYRMSIARALLKRADHAFLSGNFHVSIDCYRDIWDFMDDDPEVERLLRPEMESRIWHLKYADMN